MSNLRQAARRAGAAAALLASLLLIGCGSGGSSQETSTEAVPPKTAGNGAAGSETAPVHPAAKAEAGAGEGGGAGYQGAEEEVEEVGSEAAGSQRQAVLRAQRQYLTALSRQDFRTVCRLLAPATREQLQQLVEGRKVGCPTILPRLLGGPAASTAHVYLEGELRKVRLSGGRAFVIFHAAGARLFVIGLVREGGGWRVTTLTPSVLAPSKSAVGG